MTTLISDDQDRCIYTVKCHPVPVCALLPCLNFRNRLEVKGDRQSDSEQISVVMIPNVLF